MKLSGQQYQQFVQALISAFPSHPKLAQMLRFRLERNLDALALGGDLQEIVFKLIGAAEAEGWTAELLAAARESNPGNPGLLAFAQQFGLTSTTISRQALEKTIRAANSFLDVEQWRTKLGQMEGRVCRVEVGLKGGTEFGTGFLLGPAILITNYHVLESVITGKAKPQNTIFRFDYKRLTDGITLNPGTEYQLAEDWLIDYSPPSPVDFKTDPQSSIPQNTELDYALVRLANDPGDQPIGQKSEHDAPRRGWIEIPSQAYVFQSGAPLLILQHPNKVPLKLAFDTDAIIGLNTNNTRVRYRTNTEGGSSGSPCFNLNWELVALHHAGDPDFIPTYNEGIPFTTILELLEQRGHKDKLGEQKL